MEYNTDRLITAATTIVLALVIFAGGKIILSNNVDAIGVVQQKVFKEIDTAIAYMSVKDESETPFVFKYDETHQTATLVTWKSQYGDDQTNQKWTTDDMVHAVVPYLVKHNGQTYKVKTIGENAFGGSLYVKTLTISSGVENINKYAFAGSTIETIDIPDSVINIGDGAFKHTGLKTVTLHKGLQTIGNNAFSNNNISTVTIPNTVNSISDNAFDSSVKIIK